MGRIWNILKPAAHNQVSSPGPEEMSTENRASVSIAIPLLLVPDNQSVRQGQRGRRQSCRFLGQISPQWTKGMDQKRTEELQKQKAERSKLQKEVTYVHFKKWRN